MLREPDTLTVRKKMAEEGIEDMLLTLKINSIPIQKIASKKQVNIGFKILNVINLR